MEITNDSLPWDSENCAILRDFFKTQTGQRLIPKLAETVPTLLEGGEINAVLIRSGQNLGYTKAIQNLLGLTVPSPEQSHSADNYPPLEDDKAHNDGQTIN